jgi:influenza virus NS1A-binding protein
MKSIKLYGILTILVLGLLLGPVSPIINTVKADWEWEEVAPLPNADIGIAETYEGKIYNIGSYVQVYDPANDSWEVKGSASVGYRGGSAIVGDVIYIVNSWTQASCYDITTESFYGIPDPPTHRLDYTVAQVDGIVYVLGGWLSGDPGGITVVEAYNPQNNTWWEVAPMNVGRMDHAAVGLNGYIYAIGGHSDGGWGDSTKTVERYDPDSNTWTMVASTNAYHSDFGACAHKGNIVVGNRGQSNIISEVYVPEGDIWFEGPDIPMSNFFNAPMASCGDYAYSIGGRTAPGDRYNTVLRWEGRDQDPPNISSWVSPNRQEFGEVVEFFTKVTDNLAVSEVWIEITKENGAYFGNFSMEYIQISDQWEHAGIFDDPAIYNYTIWASDTFGNWEKDDGKFMIIEYIPPEITNCIPEDSATIYICNPAITANYTDTSGIDTKSVKLRVDNIDITSFADVNSEGITYLPSMDLVDGEHEVHLSVEDIFDNSKEKLWTFNVAMPPEITNIKPSRDSYVNDNRIPINCEYYDISGIDLNNVWMKVDGKDVTGNSQVSESEIIYSPKNPLSEGIHQVQLTVSDNNDLTASVIWNFTVDSKAPRITNQKPRSDSFTNDNTTTISAKFKDQLGIDVDRVMIRFDGVDVTSLAVVTEEGLTFTPREPLSEGEHMVSIVVYDKANNMGISTWTFSVGDAPEKDFFEDSLWILLVVGIVSALILVLLMVSKKRKRQVEKVNQPPLE